LRLNPLYNFRAISQKVNDEKLPASDREFIAKFSSVYFAALGSIDGHAPPEQQDENDEGREESGEDGEEVHGRWKLGLFLPSKDFFLQMFQFRFFPHQLLPQGENRHQCLKNLGLNSIWAHL